MAQAPFKSATGAKKPTQHVFVSKKVGENVERMLKASSENQFGLAITIASCFGPRVPEGDISAVKDAVNQVVESFRASIHEMAALPKPNVAPAAPGNHH